MSAPISGPDDGAPLVPKRPPGRSSRKASAFAGEIGRLQALGYSLESIREALAEAGVTVSKSTVQREASRQGAASDAADRVAAAAPARLSSGRHEPATRTPMRDASSTASSGPSGKDVAEAFMATQITNPFMIAKEQR